MTAVQFTDPVTILVSIDTEEDNWVPAQNGVTVANIRELPRLDRLLERLGVRATYFTAYQVARTPWCAEIIRDLAQNERAEIATHVHPWNTPPLSLPLILRNTMMANLPRDLQRAKIETVTQALHKATGRRPVTFRAGRWGFNASTASVLLDLGYRTDSSVTPLRSWEAFEGPSHIGAPLNVYRLDGRGDHRVPAAAGGLMEVPMSWGYTHDAWKAISLLDRVASRKLATRLGLARALGLLHVMNRVVLSPEVEALPDMLRLADRLIARGVRHLQVMFHSPSLVPGLTPFSATSGDVDRLYDRLAGFIEGVAARGPVRFATVGAAAESLAPPQEVPHHSKLVVVSYHFPPDRAIGGMRWAGLTKYLRKIGWRSWVVTAAPAPPVADGVAVVSQPRRLTLNDLYRRLRERSKPTVVPSAGTLDASPGPPRRWKRWLSTLRVEGSALLSLPDDGRGWVLRAARATRRLIIRERPDAVVSSGPPHSVHLATWLATRALRVPWFVDLRDPWAGPFTHGWLHDPYYRSRLARWCAAAFERLVVRSATAVICNTREFTEVMRSQYPSAAVHWIPNAVDRVLLPGRDENPFPGLALTHVGTLYLGRDLGPLLQALRRFLDANPRAAGDGTKLRIAGFFEDALESEFRRHVSALRLEPWVETLGVLPRPQALHLVTRSGLAVVPAQGQDYQVPAKLYELVAMGTPTLVLAAGKSATAGEARRLGAFAMDPSDVTGITALLERLWRGAQPSPAGEAADYAALATQVSDLLQRGERTAG